MGIQIRPGQSRGHHGPRPVGLDASPQLLRRCLCLVGVVVDHDQRLAPLATVGSPLLMTYLLVDVSGARLTERYLKGRPGFAEYQRRTAYFVPRPPRSARR